MGNQTESRVPFLDYRIIEFISGLPDDFIIREGRTKALLRDAMIDIVPSEILKRRDKIGYETPDAYWLKTEDFEKLLSDWFLRGEPLCREYIDLKKLRHQIKEHIHKNKNHARNLWKTIFLEAWLKTFFPNRNRM
jgi:asparagine synthase (glutamine-hydrolysing)